MAAAFVLVALYTWLSVVQMAVVGATADEPGYFLAGRLIRTEGWESPITYLQGPIPFCANQLFAGGDEMLDPTLKHWDEESDATLFRARLGLLPFGWLCALVVFVWARRAFGNAGGLLALALFALNPITIGYSGLLAVDIAHSATLLLALYCLWRLLERPGPGRAALTGGALGIALATKYLVLLSVPVFALLCAWKSFATSRRKRGSRGAALGRAALLTTTLGAGALVTLHAAYGFSAGLASTDPTTYKSDLLVQVLSSPSIAPLAKLIPAPFLLGVDFQMDVGQTAHAGYLDGRFAFGHWDFYLQTLLRKTPEWTVVLVVGAIAIGATGWIRGRGSARARSSALVLLSTALMYSVYLSLFATLQCGIRYVLPLLPMSFIVAASIVRTRVLRDRTRSVRIGAFGLLVAVSLLGLRSSWPDLIGYYNPSSGGQAYAYRYFRNSNTEWGQYRRADLSSMCPEGHADVELIPALAGPRFGCLAVATRTLTDRDPENEDRSYHWILALERNLQPLARIGGTWCLFHSTPEAWEEVVGPETDERTRANLALAYLGAGDVESFERHLARLGVERRAPLEELALAVEEARPQSADFDSVSEAARAWAELKRHDLAIELLRTHPNPAVREDENYTYQLGRALAYAGKLEEAVTHLEQSYMRTRERTARLLSRLYEELGKHDRALAALEAALADAPQARRERLEELIDQARARLEYMHGVGGVLRIDT